MHNSRQQILHDRICVCLEAINCQQNMGMIKRYQINNITWHGFFFQLLFINKHVDNYMEIEETKSNTIPNMS